MNLPINVLRALEIEAKEELSAVGLAGDRELFEQQLWGMIKEAEEAESEAQAGATRLKSPRFTCS